MMLLVPIIQILAFNITNTHKYSIVSVIDNLIKGAAGQALQNLNLMYGFNETEGLESSPFYL